MPVFKRTNQTPTIYDVAKLAGVSTATVSRVLSRSELVTEATRQRVQSAIEELRFKPNMNARGLVTKVTNLIEVFFHNHKYPVGFKSDWYSDIMTGATHVIQGNHYGMLVNSLIGVTDKDEIIKRLLHNRVDGILMIAPSLDEEALQELADQPTPIVLVAHRTQHSHLAFVDSNNIEASEQMVDHLYKLGHRRIACLAGPAHQVENAKDRLEGFKRAVVAKKLSIPENWFVLSDGFLKVNGYENMKRLLKMPEKPTAVFCAGDTLAMGAWKAIEEAGLTVGKDISLTGYDDVPEVSAEPYSLTTIHQDVQSLSAMGARMLVKMINGELDAASRQQYLPGELMIRRSTGPVQ